MRVVPWGGTDHRKGRLKHALDRQQLIETQSIITIAREKNWSRQLEMNERVEQNLQAIVTTLEGQADDA